ncbi:hypothetical protein HDV04_004510 [Boothiomyces sp. JEL0838]|nr:hypothetical protein HDV04_004510 [Boothiomyces sp. JEL0838]
MEKEAQKEAQLQPSPSPPAYSEIDENLGNIVGESSKCLVNEDQCELEDKEKFGKSLVGESSKSTVNEDQCEPEDKEKVDEKQSQRKDLLEPKNIKKAANKKKPNEPWLVNTAPRNVYNTPIEPWTTNPNLQRSHSHHQNDTYCVVCCFDNNGTNYGTETYGYHQPELDFVHIISAVPVMILALTTVVAPYSVMKIATTLVAMKGVVTTHVVMKGVVTTHVVMKGVVGFWVNCYIVSQQY